MPIARFGCAAGVVVFDEVKVAAAAAALPSQTILRTDADSAAAKAGASFLRGVLEGAPLEAFRMGDEAERLRVLEANGRQSELESTLVSCLVWWLLLCGLQASSLLDLRTRLLLTRLLARQHHLLSLGKTT